MKIHNILKVFSLVVILHSALVVMLFMQPGCNSVSSTATVSQATPVGDSNYSDMWATQRPATTKTIDKQVVAENRQLPAKSDAVSSKVAYSEMDVNEDFVDLAGAEFQTAAVYSETGEHFEYTVQKGDSLWKIANTNGISMRKVMEFNNLKETDYIKPGQTLLIPGKAKASVAYAQLEVPTVKEEPVVEEKVVEPEVVVAEVKVEKVTEPTAARVKEEKAVELAKVELAQPMVNKFVAEPMTEGEGIHEVEPGDSLYLIAMHNNTTIEEIRALNGLDSSLIKAGQKIRIPGKYKGPLELPEKKQDAQSFAVAFNEVPVENAGAEYLQHEVQPGEYPGLIARKYNMSLADLLHINDIRNPRMLRVGTTLKVVNPDAMIQQTQVANNGSDKSEEAVASNMDTDTNEEEVSVINDFDDFPVIRVGS